MEGCVGPILTAPLCLHFHTLLSHYKRTGSNRTDTEDTGEERSTRGKREKKGRSDIKSVQGNIRKDKNSLSDEILESERKV